MSLGTHRSGLSLHLLICKSLGGRKETIFSANGIRIFFCHLPRTFQDLLKGILVGFGSKLWVYYPSQNNTIFLSFCIGKLLLSSCLKFSFQRIQHAEMKKDSSCYLQMRWWIAVAHISGAFRHERASLLGPPPYKIVAISSSKAQFPPHYCREFYVQSWTIATKLQGLVLGLKRWKQIVEIRVRIKLSAFRYETLS